MLIKIPLLISSKNKLTRELSLMSKISSYIKFCPVHMAKIAPINHPKLCLTMSIWTSIWSVHSIIMIKIKEELYYVLTRMKILLIKPIIRNRVIHNLILMRIVKISLNLYSIPSSISSSLVKENIAMVLICVLLDIQKRKKPNGMKNSKN